VLLDSYGLNANAVRAQTSAARLAVMHDIGPLPECADLIITTDPARVGSRPRVVGGPQLSCLGPMFWGLPDPRPVPGSVGSLLITTGGGDPGGHAAAIAGALLAALPESVITLVRGPHAPLLELAGIRVLDRPRSLLEPLRAADLVITSAGNSLLEGLAVGVPTVAVILAENQRAGAQALADRGATQIVEPEPLEALISAVRRLSEDAAARAAQVRAGRGLVDGHGALRVAYLLSEL
jgi:spore coat polysaccharide biosynthesis predicted glycosyltransferase SpsG